MAASVYFREIRAGDIARIADNMREADRREVIAARGNAGIRMRVVLANAVLMSSRSWTCVAADHEPAALLGVVPLSLLNGIGSPWLLGTDRIDDFAVSFVKQGRKRVQDMLDLFPRLVNYVDARNDRTIKWLVHLGFELSAPEPYGVAGMPFRRFEMGE